MAPVSMEHFAPRRLVRATADAMIAGIKTAPRSMERFAPVACIAPAASQ